jgi:hypothetical protein
MALVLMTALIHPPTSAAQGPPAGAGSPVVLEGELDVQYEDDNRDGRLVHVLNTANGRVPLRFHGPPPELPSGSRVRITGDLADGAVTTSAVTTLGVSTTRTLGSQSVLVILFNFSNNRVEPYTAASTATVNDEVTNFYLEGSYGQTVMSFTVAGWFTIAATDAGCDYYTWATQAEAAATAAGVNLAAYDRRVLAFPPASSCSWWGTGNVAGPRSWINGRYATRVVAHELAHNFGNYHSLALTCDAASCASVEYGDDRDVLGANGIVGHLTAFQKERLGWLNFGVSPTLQTVTAAGDYWIENYETLRGQSKGLKIWNPATSTYYYVESRARMGFDSNVADGVVLHTGSPTTGNSSYEIDLAPTTTAFDSTLDVGQVFTDSAIGLTIQTISTSVDGAMVRVGFGATPCVAKAPRVSVASSAPLRYTIIVTNNDGVGCTAAPHVVTATIPSGWIAAWSPASPVSIAPGATASLTLSLTAPPATAAGSYPFGVNVVNNTSGQSGAATGTAVVAASLAVSAAATVSIPTKGNGNASASIVVTAAAGQVPVAGATVTIVLTKPNGDTATLNATTASTGAATANYTLKPKEPSGLYLVAVTATSNGSSAAASTSFKVP